MTAYLGEIMALATALFWAFTSVLFTLASQRAGSQVVNRGRLLLATGLLSLAHLISQGTLFPLDVSAERWAWLGVSAVIGLVAGDGLLFYAFTQIGPQLSMLLMALSPVMGTLIAWVYLGETLQLEQIAAILVTISGVSWVVMKRNAPANGAKETPRHYGIGVLCGLGAALGQAVGLVLSKEGMVGDFPALSASLIRVAVATVAIWIMALFQHQARSTVVALGDRRTFRMIASGALVGPAIGMTLSLAAVQLSPVGIASTLMSLSPILLIPLGHWFFQECIDAPAVMGTTIAMAGVAMLFLL